MAPKAKAAPDIDPDAKYKIAFSSSFEHGGVKYVPRAGVTIKVLGSILAEIKDNVDSYEVA